MTSQELIHQKQLDSEPPKHMRPASIVDATLTLDSIISECMKRGVNPADKIASFINAKAEDYGLEGRDAFAADREVARLALDAWKMSQPKDQIKTPSKIEIEWG